MRRLVAGAGLAVVAVAGLPVTPAFATHPCAIAPDGTRYDPVFTADHDACGGGLPAAQPGDVTVGLADNGTTVTVPLGARLLVALDAVNGGPVWSEIDSGPALHRAYLDVQRPRTSAVFDASRATAGEQVTATGPVAWSVRVVVPAPSSPSPSPSQSQPPTACAPGRAPAPYGGAVVLTDADNGRTVQVYRGEDVGVFFAGCTGGPDLRPAVATAPLLRYRAQGYNPGAASAVFTASATGTATITSTTDAPCLHTAPACAPPQQQWQATINVVEHCEIVGAARGPAGTEAGLYGRFAPGATVQIWFRPYGATTFTARRTLIADPNGNVLTSYRAVTDQRWYATSSQGCTSAAGLTQVTPRVSGPASATRGTVVPVTVIGPAGATVQVWFNNPGKPYVLRRTGRLDANGVYKTSYVADVDHRYYAVTGPGQRVTAVELTTVR
ncbi:MAG: hypothetical protein NVS3B26_22500 [Mycobacteriales bacterium]